MAVARYVLMNKNTPVLAFEYDLDEHKAVRVTRTENLDAAPVGLADRHGEISKHQVNYWWHHRAIPASRAHVKRLLENLRIDSTLVLAERSFGLSLSDRYWLTTSPMTWGSSPWGRTPRGRRPTHPTTRG